MGRLDELMEINSPRNDVQQHFHYNESNASFSMWSETVQVEALPQFRRSIHKSIGINRWNIAMILCAREEANEY